MTATHAITATFTSPTAVLIGSFSAQSVPEGVLLRWETDTEYDMLGFYLWRQGLPDGPWETLNEGEIILAMHMGEPLGARYAFLDATAVAGQRYAYRLAGVDHRLGVRSDRTYIIQVSHWEQFRWFPLVVTEHAG
jgi:hypothetical protein